MNIHIKKYTYSCIKDLHNQDRPYRLKNLATFSKFILREKIFAEFIFPIETLKEKYFVKFILAIYYRKNLFQESSHFLSNSFQNQK